MPRRAPSGRGTRSSKVSKAVQFESYLLEIEGLDVDYSLSANGDSTFSQNGLVEHQHFTIRSRLLSPKRFAGREVAVTLIGDRERDTLLSGPEIDVRFEAVGSLTLRGTRSTYLGTLPSTALWGLVPALSSGIVRYITLFGSPLHRGAARISTFSLQSTYDPEDYPS